MLRKHHIDPVLLNAYPVLVFNVWHPRCACN